MTRLGEMNPRSTDSETDALTTTPSDCVESNPASLLVVSLGETLNGIPPSLCGKQVVGPSSLPVVMAQSDERHANRARAHTHGLKHVLYTATFSLKAQTGATVNRLKGKRSTSIKKKRFLCAALLRYHK